MYDPNDYGLRNPETGQFERYPTLSEEDRAKGFVRPVRETYWHQTCKTLTSMSRAIAETYAVDPHYYSHTFCAACKDHLPVEEFRWVEEGTITDLKLGS